MRRNLEVGLLKKIAGIRQLQHAAAKAEFARANFALSEKTETLKLQKIEEKTVEQHWQDAVSGPSLRLEITPIWADAVTRQGALTQRAAGAVESAATARDRSVTALYMAERRSDAAAEQVRYAWTEHLRKLEEDAVQDAADRHLQHGAKL